MRLLFSQIWSSLLSAGAVSLLAAMFIAAMPPVYKATATVRGQPDDMLFIRSGDLLRGVIRQSNVEFSDLRGWMEQLTSAELDSLTLLSQKLKVVPGDQNNWIDITVEAADAQSAADLANEIARAYLQRVASKELSVDEKQRLFVKVEEVEERIAAFLRNNTRFTAIKSERQQLTEADREIERLAVTITNRLNQHQAELVGIRTNDLSTVLDGNVRNAQSRLSQLRERRAFLGERYGDRHKNMAAHDAELAQAESRLTDAIAAYVDQLNEKIRLENVLLEETKVKLQLNEAVREELRQLQVEHELLQRQRQTALDEFNGISRQNEVTEFAEAAQPQSHLGLAQLVWVGYVFVGTFFLMWFLLVVRQVSRS